MPRAKHLRPEGRVGLAIFVLLTLCGILAEPLAPFDPWAPTGLPYLAPCREHPLGTNDIGQDILSEILYSLRISLSVGLGAALLATAIGVCVGLLSGYFGRSLDDCLMGLTDTLMLIPALPLMIVLVAYLGPGVWKIAAVIGLIWWTGTARAVRAGVLQLRRIPYIEAARALGLGPGRILFKHLLPNVFPVVLARFLIAVPEAILTEAGLSFLGLGDPTGKSLGLMLNYAFQRGGLINGQWWWFTFPILALALLVLSLSLLTFGFERDD